MPINLNKISNNSETATDIYTVLCAAFCGAGKTYICEKTELVRMHQNELKNCSIPDVMVELPDYDFYCVECGSGSNDGICPKCNKKGN